MNGIKSTCMYASHTVEQFRLCEQFKMHESRAVLKDEQFKIHESYIQILSHLKNMFCISDLKIAITRQAKSHHPKIEDENT